jgi:DNA-binding transcriptional LysR family regulator
MDTIASMRAFVAVAKTGSFSTAAQKLDLVPSVITKRVTQLERTVGTTLFHRSTCFLGAVRGRNVYLLPQRRKFQPRALPATETDLRPSKQ